MEISSQETVVAARGSQDDDFRLTPRPPEGDGQVEDRGEVITRNGGACQVGHGQ